MNVAAARKKILLVNCYHTGGGAESVFCDNMEIATGLGHQVRTYIGAPDSTTKPAGLAAYIFSKAHKERILSVLEEFRPDIIHIHGLSHLLSPSILHAIRIYRRNAPISTIYTAHDFHLLSPNSGAYYFRRFDSGLVKIDKRPSLLNSLLRKWDHRGEVYSVAKILQWNLAYRILGLQSEIDTIVCPSRFMADKMASAFPSAKITVVHNPVQLRSIPAPTRELRKTPKIIFFGRLSFEKGISNFLEAMESFPSPFEITVIGDGPMLEELRDSWANKGIRFFGRTTRATLRLALLQYDIFVLPSLWYENAPLSIIEAGNAGLLVATSNFGGMPEMAAYLGEGRATTFDPSSSESIRSAITRLVSWLPADGSFPDLTDFSFQSYAANIQALYLAS